MEVIIPILDLIWKRRFQFDIYQGLMYSYSKY